jgi:nicotinate-nucleotide pyrophosphorylase (carboxylating)
MASEHHPVSAAAAGLDEDQLAELVRRALAEDIGPGDATGEATVAPDARARGRITQRAPGVIYGLDLAEAAFRALDGQVGIERLVAEGEWRDGGPVLDLEGSARALLAAERTALNFLARLSGVATMAARCVQAVQGTGARVLDTRKTTPGLRALEKAAVAAGGGVNHRAGLYDAILIKENHVAMAGGVGEAVARARAHTPELPIEVECRTPREIDQALQAGAERLLLDNMSPFEVRAAVHQVAGRAELEASGGITPENVREYARTGVQWISVGALTHSAPALDLSLSLEPVP